MKNPSVCCRTQSSHQRYVHMSELCKMMEIKAHARQSSRKKISWEHW